MPPARTVADLLQAFHREAAALRARLPVLGLSPMAQSHLRMIVSRLEAETAIDASRQGPLDGYLGARLEERLDLLRELPTRVADHQARVASAAGDDGTWVDGLVAAGAAGRREAPHRAGTAG